MNAEKQTTQLSKTTMKAWFQHSELQEDGEHEPSHTYSTKDGLIWCPQADPPV